MTVILVIHILVSIVLVGVVLMQRSEGGALGVGVGGQGFGVFKPALAELAVEKLGPVADRMRQLTDNPSEVDRVLADGADRAGAIAEGVLKDVRQTVGFWSP